MVYSIYQRLMHHPDENLTTVVTGLCPQHILEKTQLVRDGEYVSCHNKEQLV